MIRLVTVIHKFTDHKSFRLSKLPILTYYPNVNYIIQFHLSYHSSGIWIMKCYQLYYAVYAVSENKLTINLSKAR
jgi:hypothetical protein